MSAAFCSWSVRDVKQWINSWDAIPDIDLSTITNMKSAADTHHIDGQKLIYLSRDDLKECGLQQRDVKAAISRIDDLVLGAYLDYVFEHLYDFSEFTNQRRYSLSDSPSPSPRSMGSLASSPSNKSLFTPQNVLKEGWVLKKAENEVISRYEKCFLRLQSHRLLCYKRDKRQYPKERPTRCFDLKGALFRAESNAKDRVKFYLFNDSAKTLRKFKAKSEADRNEWVQNIRCCISFGIGLEEDVENREAMDSVTAMGDRRPRPRRNRSVRSVNDGGDGPESEFIAALAANKEVQSAARSAARDEKVQRAAFGAVKKNATAGNVKKAGRFMGSAASFL